MHNGRLHVQPAIVLPPPLRPRAPRRWQPAPPATALRPWNTLSRRRRPGR